jgi:hypothetical protein
MTWLEPWDPVVPGEGVEGDDALFALEDGTGRVAVVHLTWTRSPPETLPWPGTRLYATLEAWATTAMANDHAEFME